MHLVSEIHGKQKAQLKMQDWSRDAWYSDGGMGPGLHSLIIYTLHHLIKPNCATSGVVDAGINIMICNDKARDSPDEKRTARSCY